MKKIIKIFFIIIVVVALAYLGAKIFGDQGEVEIAKTDSLFYTNIVQKSIAAGSINPRKEINLKSNVSGIIEALFVEAGDHVKIGQKIAKIRIIPNVVRLNQAKDDITRAQIALDISTKEFRRQKKLMKNEVISVSTFNQAELDYQLKKQAVISAKNNYQLIKEGASKKMANTQATNIVYATNSGKILDVPNKQGAFVIEANTMNDGTTIASVANMNDLIFEGAVDESEVSKLNEGMELSLDIGALDDDHFKADLEFISPKGNDENGAIKFKIRAALTLPPNHGLRAGYSANADIILGKKENVLAIQEKNIIFEDRKKYVMLKSGENEFEKTEINIGITDGINAEIIKGIDKDAIVKSL